MARRKSVCIKWTLVFLIVIFSPYVLSRPQLDSSTLNSTTNSVQTDKTTESAIRYRFRQSTHSFDKFRLPIVIDLINNGKNNSSSNLISNNFNKTRTNIRMYSNDKVRQNRMISATVVKGNFVNGNRPNRKVNQQNNKILLTSSRRPMIRKVVTKWRDKANYDDLNFSPEASTSSEADPITSSESAGVDDYSSTENIVDQSVPARKRPHYQKPNKFYNKLDTNKQYEPDYDSSAEDLGVVHSNKVHIIEYPFPSVRPAYIFTTPMPTPIITNVGNPKPWSPHKNGNRKTTQKPVRKKPLNDKYSSHNKVHHHQQYGGNQFEVTTFQPSDAYTERIVIRPEEYSASNDCPTVYLTLNNTFQGQGKEACPDLNIAVNTNVINKNVVVESDEDGTDDLLPGGFGLPFGEDSEGDDAATGNDYLDSDEDGAQDQEQAESASVEATGLSNYNAAHQPDYEETNGGGHPSAAISHGHGKPGKPGNNDDEFSLSGVVSFFKPAFDAMAWLAAINPFSFSVMSILLTPIVMLIAGYSGVAALFAPLGLGREASTKVIHVYKPKWEWDDKYKTWYLNSFPNNREWRPTRLPRNSKEDENKIRSDTARPTLFFRLKKWMIDMTERLRTNYKNIESTQNTRKNKRKKRETWTRRVK